MPVKGSRQWHLVEARAWDREARRLMRQNAVMLAGAAAQARANARAHRVAAAALETNGVAA